MSTVQNEVDERTNLTANNKFELMLFKLGIPDGGARSELFGINVFKVREILVMPVITALAGANSALLGVANIRGQIIPVIDLPSLIGCIPKTGLNILIVTEYGRSVQAFAVEEVDEIVRLDWGQVLSAEASGVGGMVTSIARLDGDMIGTRLAQVLDVEQILRNVIPASEHAIDMSAIGPAIALKKGAVVLAADDSQTARSMIEQGFHAMGIEFVMTKSGKEAWDRLQLFESQARQEGVSIRDKVALVLTDLEMPEMDGFTLTRNIKQDPRFKSVPVIIHSSLSGVTNEDHVKKVGANAYVAKFVAEELAATIRNVIAQNP